MISKKRDTMPSAPSVWKQRWESTLIILGMVAWILRKLHVFCFVFFKRLFFMPPKRLMLNGCTVLSIILGGNLRFAYLTSRPCTRLWISMFIADNRGPNLPISPSNHTWNAPTVTRFMKDSYKNVQTFQVSCFTRLVIIRYKPPTKFTTSFQMNIGKIHVHSEYFNCIIILGSMNGSDFVSSSPKPPYVLSCSPNSSPIPQL